MSQGLFWVWYYCWWAFRFESFLYLAAIIAQQQSSARKIVSSRHGSQCKQIIRRLGMWRHKMTESVHVSWWWMTTIISLVSRQRKHNNIRSGLHWYHWCAKPWYPLTSQLFISFYPLQTKTIKSGWHIITTLQICGMSLLRRIQTVWQVLRQFWIDG